MMYNKFKNNEIVMVTGFGKENGTYYEKKIAKVICRDPFFLDYNVRFKDGTTDWVDVDCLEKLEGEN
mgnify:FL=1